MCNATTGTKLASECLVEMSYDEFYEHCKQHHRKRLYRCTLCTHDTYYETKEELAEEHWMQNCHNSIFHPIYKLCKVCGMRLKKKSDGTVDIKSHKCEEIL